MRQTILLSIFFALFVPHADAHVPVVVEQESQQQIFQIEDPVRSQSFYGDFQDFPHTYQVISGTDFRLFVKVLVPDITSSENNVSGIIVRQNENGGVTEIARLRARDASWEQFHEPYGNDSYRRGGSFDGTLEPGSYLIEVSTPDNVEKYVLSVGYEERFVISDYFTTVKEIARVKQFFGKPWIFVFESPVVYIPTVLIFGIIGVLWWYRRKLKEIT